MNSYFKGLLIFVGVVISFIVIVVVWYNYQKERNQRRAQTDEIKFSKLCDSSKLITEMPYIMLSGFDSSELRKMHFYIIRQGKYARDTAIVRQVETVNNFTSIQLPFDRFLKTDTILVETAGQSKRYFCLTGFHHYAYLHYGMMGYLGSYDCRLDDQNFLINGKYNDGRLERKFGLHKIDGLSK